MKFASFILINIGAVCTAWAWGWYLCDKHANAVGFIGAIALTTLLGGWALEKIATIGIVGAAG